MERTTLLAASDRAAETAKEADSVIDAAFRDRQVRLTLIQTAVVGALLMVLAAIQSLGYQTDWLPAS